LDLKELKEVEDLKEHKGHRVLLDHKERKVP
jgi:hypothetical protein